MRAIVLFLMVAAIGVAETETARAAGPASALDERAPVIVEASPRERYFAWLVVRGITVEGDAEKDSLARTWEALDFAVVERRVKDALRAGRGDAEIEASFAEAREARKIPRDDANRLAGWLAQAKTSAAMSMALRPFVVSLRAAVAGKAAQ